MKTLSKVVSIIIAFVSVAFLASMASIVFSEQIRADKNSFPYSFVSAGCFLDTYAVYILCSVFVFIGIEMALKVGEVSRKDDAANSLSKWKRILTSHGDETPLMSMASTLMRLMLVLFFISQLSFHVNHCR